MRDLIGEWRAPLCMHSAVMSACADDPRPPADNAWVLLLLPILAGLVGQWRLRRDNLRLRRQLAQAEAHHLTEVARLQHARDAAVKALCGKLRASGNVHQGAEARHKEERSATSKFFVSYFVKTLPAVLKDRTDTTHQT